ncbi:NAD(P)H-hydrate dehydratase [Candidatus Marinamargulisbacteria bacterium SCGC AG-439-L15]|nr:NAD(P)H-hydrate dehydratase [Candidatus Marinamargulisbacteria bacterium SCGC AG-439-L15]
MEKGDFLDYKTLLPKRQVNAHKGSCGRVGIIAGSASMLGAALLVAQAALRSGSGLVYLMTIPEAVGVLNVQFPELIVLPVKSERGVLTQAAFPEIQHYHQTYCFTTLAIGPGLGRAKSTQSLVRDCLSFGYEKKIPTVLDADALYALNPEDFNGDNLNSFVLTPHPKEFAHFMNDDSEIIDRESVAKAAAVQLGQVVVLKGSGTVIASAQECHVNLSGNAGMATAGSGDVLTGVISGLLAQGVGTYDAAKLGVFLHGLAGDLAMEEKSVYAMIASDLLLYLGAAFIKTMEA